MTEQPETLRSDLPPLRVHHLLAWTAATGLLISLCAWFDRTARNGPSIEDPAIVAVLFVAAISVAGALSFAGWGLYWRRHSRAFPTEPGQWLLVELAAAACAVVIWIAATFVVFFIEEDWLRGSHLLSLVTCVLAWLWLNILVARRCDTAAWRGVFWLLAAVPLLCWWLFFDVVATAALVGAAWNDRRRRLARHWTHWLGVAFWLALCLSWAVARL